MHLLPELTRGLVQVFPLGLDIRIIRIYEHADRGGFWDELVQQLQPLCSKINEIVSYAGCVPARVIETAHETRRDRVSSSGEYDRDHGSCSLGRKRRRRGSRGYDGHLPTHQIGRQGRQSVVLAFCPPILDRHVATFDKTGLIQALVECG